MSSLHRVESNAEDSDALLKAVAKHSRQVLLAQDAARKAQTAVSANMSVGTAEATASSTNNKAEAVLQPGAYAGCPGTTDFDRRDEVRRSMVERVALQPKVKRKSSIVAPMPAAVEEQALPLEQQEPIEAYVVRAEDELDANDPRLSAHLEDLQHLKQEIQLIRQQSEAVGGTPGTKVDPWTRMVMRMSEDEGPLDPETLKRRAAFLVMVILRHCLGPIWIITFVVLGDPLTALLPFVLLVVGAGALLGALAGVISYDTFSIIDTFLIFTIPLLGQVRLGGVVASGGVGQWSFLAPLGAVYFRSAKESVRWYLAYMGLSTTLVAWEYWGDFSAAPTPATSLYHFAMNNLGLLSIAFFVAHHFAVSHEKEANQQRLKQD